MFSVTLEENFICTFYQTTLFFHLNMQVILNSYINTEKKKPKIPLFILRQNKTLKSRYFHALESLTIRLQGRVSPL
ncbi:hypothetical protein HanRHA438_Chr06g0264831 [Helianthus annuus]|nr:hypothetical protein HanIR_Chr06g0275101 [Helianthus annuus]KAJ0911592.1 hypothetical protein HanRHA438_Chr06g0264831 [Helianthus annuus]